MGFWDNLWEGATGQGAKKSAKKSQGAAKKTAAGIAERAVEAGKQYDTGAAQSMGANAAEYLQKAGAAAAPQAEQQARAAAIGASRAGLQAARTAGINPGQAALAGSQQAGNVYGQQFQQGLESGRQQYGQATQQFAQQGAEMAGRGLQGAGLQAGIGTQQYGQAQGQAQSTIGGITKLAGAAAGLLSDENLKTDVQPVEALDQVVARLRPVKFRYKEGLPANPGEQVGVMAQEVEKTPLAGAVVETPAGKALDTGQLEGGNLALIVEMGARIKELERKLQEGSRG